MCKRRKDKERAEKETHDGGKSDRSDLGLTRKEKRAMIRAALATYLPILLGVLACFGLAALAMYLWL